MSEDDDTPNMTPLSSSSVGTSGTQAWNITIDEKSDASEVQKPDNFAADEVEQQSVANTDQENLPPHSGEESASEQAETPADAIEAAQEEAPVAAEAVEPVAMPQTEPASEPVAFEEASETEEELADDGQIETEAAAPEPETQTTEELRQAILDSMADHNGGKQEAVALFERMSQDFSVMMKTARDDAAAFSFKLMEFAQENAKNNFELARACSEARSIPEIFRLQANYMNRQLELLTSQAKELQTLTSELTVKSVMDMKSR